VRNVLVLWDVDYTLINAGGVGAHLYGVVFRDLFGRDLPGMAWVDGRTDRAIIADTLAGAGIAEPQRYVDAFLAGMQARAPSLAGLARQRVRALPGAAATLAELAALAGAFEDAPEQTAAGAGTQASLPRAAGSPLLIVQSVLTGNMRPLAEVKLQAPGLARYLNLDAGAFGGEHEIRSDLVHIARRNAFLASGREFAGEETVLVGDTPLDVAAALAAGARAVGVATGHSTADELAAAGAHAVLPDLTDSAAAIAAILGSPD
jgi:phosphoglycolate phosphatase